jgi:uncharacterized cupin superfamily protein
MAGHTKVNLREVEDFAPEHGFGERQEARFAREALDCEQTGISLQRIKPGQRQGFGHSHGEDEEVYVVLSGSGRAKLDDELVELGPMDAIRVAPAVARSFEAGPEGLELIAFGTHSEDDAQVVPDFWAG